MSPSARLSRQTEEAISRLAARLADEKRLVIGAHVDPDGDAIGSMCALAAALGGAGVEVYASLADDGAAPRTYRDVPGIELLGPAGRAPEWPAVLALDVPAFSRLGALEPRARAASFVARVDHHPFGETFGPYDVADAEAPATAVLVWRLITAMGLVVTPAISEALYVGLVTDTGRFQYSNATTAAFAMAFELVGNGVRPDRVFGYLYDSQRLEALRLEALVIERAQLRLAGRLVWASVSDDDLERLGALPEETENLIDALRSIEGTEVALFLKVHADGLRGSLRSKGAVDVSVVARAMGGGGHRAAAGFPCSGTVLEAVARIEGLVAEALNGATE